MMCKQYLFVVFWALCFLASPSFAGVTFNQNQIDIVVPPSCNHVPVNLPYVPDQSLYDDSSIVVSSDSDWVIPTVDSESNNIEIAFSTEDLIASYTATVLVDDGDSITELFVHLNVSPLDVYRLIDDPLRSMTYGIHRDGIKNGSVIAFDPVQESLASCITVGESPTDFVINEDSSELLVINSVSESIDVIDLESFTLKETLLLPVYNAWGDADDTTANIDLGPNNVIYYTDGEWAPVLHVLDRDTLDVLQSTIIDSNGFMDFAVTSDKTKMIAMPQHGWSAGSHSSRIAQFTINTDGTVNFVKETTLPNFAREPFEAPVLMRSDDQFAVMKTISASPADTDQLDRVFPSAVWSMNANGSVVATADKLYEYDTGIELYTLPGNNNLGSGYTDTKAQAFTSDFSRFVYFNNTDRTLNVINLIDEIGLELLGRSLTPANDSVVNSPETLIWAPLSGIDQYDVYIGTDENLIAAADHSSPSYRGRATGTSFDLSETLNNGVAYYWRIDPVSSASLETGPVYTFTVSEIELDISEIDVKTVTGHSDYQVSIQLTSQNPNVSWTATAADSWVTFTETTGSTPSTLNVHLDASALAAGFHKSSITLSSSEGQFQIPVQLEVDPLVITHIRSDRDSSTTYAISEDTNSTISQAYLLEIDSDAEQIQRVIPVGSSVTDIAIHYADNLIYVTNWRSGGLLAFDKDTLEHLKTIAFQSAEQNSYSGGDVFRVAAGVSQRIVVEEEDQWVDIDLFNSFTEASVDTEFVREGGGAFDPTGRYYYHGENNSSGASIIKFDTSGDTFTNLAEIRPPEISSYHGSRTVVVSEDGSRIFWAGVALDQDLNTEWGIEDIIYSTSFDGRYAFGETAIYDVNLRRQVLSMPADTTVSGYNTTSEKLITQVGDDLEFFSISSPISLPAPLLSASNPGYTSIDLSWTDKSLEMEFNIQQRVLNSGTWADVKSLPANESSWIASGLQEGLTYEFRVRASTTNNSSPWSNIAQATVLQRPNEAPIAGDDRIGVPNISTNRFSVTDNDWDADGELDYNSIVIVTQPQFGHLTVLSGGELSYTSTNGFIETDSFSYTIDDNEGASSTPATVSLSYRPTPVLTASNSGFGTVDLSWTIDQRESVLEYEVQERTEYGYWYTTRFIAASLTRVTLTQLQPGTSNDFRIRAIYLDTFSPWSNIATATETTGIPPAVQIFELPVEVPVTPPVEHLFVPPVEQPVVLPIEQPVVLPVEQPVVLPVEQPVLPVIPPVEQPVVLPPVEQANEPPVAKDDVITLGDLASRRFSVTLNDTDVDGEVDLSSLTIVSQPQFGEVLTHANGDVTYTPGDNFTQTDSFTYTVNDNNSATSTPATVEIVYAPVPVLSVTNNPADSIELRWTVDASLESEFVIQKRTLGAIWRDAKTTAVNAKSWTDTDLLQGLTYEFRIRSRSSGFSSAWSNIATATLVINASESTPTDTQVPDVVSAPDKVPASLSAGGGSANLFSLFVLAIFLACKRTTIYRRRVCIKPTHQAT